MPAITVTPEQLNKLVTTLEDLPPGCPRDGDYHIVTDGVRYMVYSSSGYSYPRYKSNLYSSLRKLVSEDDDDLPSYALDSVRKLLQHIRDNHLPK